MTLQNRRDSETSLRRHSSPQRFLIPFLIASCSGSGHPPGSDASVVPVLVPAAVAQAAPAPVPAAPPDLTGMRTAIDLVANRVHAVAHRDGRLVIDAGDLDFLKYVDGGWKTSWLARREGRRASRRPWWPGCRRCSICPSTPMATARAERRRRLDAVADDARLATQAARLGVRQREAGRHARGRARPASATTSPCRGPAARRRQPRAAHLPGAGDVAGGKRSRRRADRDRVRPGVAGPARPRPVPPRHRARVDLGGTRRRARSPRAATRGSRSTCSCRRAPRWRWP